MFVSKNPGSLIERRMNCLFITAGGRKVRSSVRAKSLIFLSGPPKPVLNDCLCFHLPYFVIELGCAALGARARRGGYNPYDHFGGCMLLQFHDSRLECNELLH
jgi:hypothetical protein